MDGSYHLTSEVFGLFGADCDTVQAESVKEFVENEQIELGEAGHVSMTGVIVDIGEAAQEAGLADAADIGGESLTVTQGYTDCGEPIEVIEVPAERVDDRRSEAHAAQLLIMDQLRVAGPAAVPASVLPTKASHSISGVDGTVATDAVHHWAFPTLRRRTNLQPVAPKSSASTRRICPAPRSGSTPAATAGDHTST